MLVVGPCLPQLDLLFVNESEAEQLTGWAPPNEAARCLRDHGASDVIIKLGPRGCVWYSEDGTEHCCAAFKIEPVDSTGAGDAFVAGFLAALHRGRSPESASLFANAVGALVTTKLGGGAGVLPFEKTVEWIAARS
jgi:ribokinase